jgi:hypothetical protein
MDALDYPPNQFLRWNSTSLQNALRAHGFSVLSIKKEKPTLAHTVQQINNKLRFGISRLAPELPHWFRDEIQENPEEKARSNHVGPRCVRAVQALGRAKHRFCFPLALVAFPYVKWHSFVGPYLYCLARKLD